MIELGNQSSETPKRVWMWNNKDGYKICGNSAPLYGNVQKYLERSPDMEIYCGQDHDDRLPENWRMETHSGKRVRLTNGRLFLRDKETKRRLGGNACPLYRNMDTFLRKNPRYERTTAPPQREQQVSDQSLDRLNKNRESMNSYTCKLKSSIISAKVSSNKREIAPSNKSKIYFDFGNSMQNDLLQDPLNSRDDEPNIQLMLDEEN